MDIVTVEALLRVQEPSPVPGKVCVAGDLAVLVGGIRFPAASDRYDGFCSNRGVFLSFVALMEGHQRLVIN